ncbi:MAG: 4Fe-4S binding protein [Coriobacteriales bacterium]|nr:4Fe-4S binding protein [Coriobacteriales bacterium]
MPRPLINSDECSACGICVDACEQDVLDIVGDSVAVVNEDACIACGNCMEECPMGAIEEIEED